jgi:hypothetical protein
MPLVLILRYMNSVHSFTAYSFKIHLSIYYTGCLKSLYWYLVRYLTLFRNVWNRSYEIWKVWWILWNNIKIFCNFSLSLSDGGWLWIVFLWNVDINFRMPEWQYVTAFKKLLGHLSQMETYWLFIFHFLYVYSLYCVAVTNNTKLIHYIYTFHYQAQALYHMQPMYMR